MKWAAEVVALLAVCNTLVIYRMLILLFRRVLGTREWPEHVRWSEYPPSTTATGDCARRPRRDCCKTRNAYVLLLPVFVTLMKPTTVLAAGAGAGAAVLAIRQLERWCDRDECWLALADRIRRQLPPPPQSSFRVVAVVALGSRLRGEYVGGTTIEAGNLHNSVCAERVAFGAADARARHGSEHAHAARPKPGRRN